ncbi:hypothetical protein OQJ26_05485 [Legionella sp. PATHC038]|uniref:hypothetical protein n=1 Tax=Legionella sheltonii TaxID=2992041 RepID=UPI0022438979|nr:hypothetical protein [Legionella sp. PATHC038]MCW8398241.1 hypothetical protein [Legionella sp. PATHC038]
MGLKEIITEVEKEVGLFSQKYKTIEGGHTYTIPFSQKPAEQLLTSLGGMKDPSAILSSATPAIHTSGNADVTINGFTPKTADKKLVITGKRLDHLLQSGKIYVNTALFPAGLYQKVLNEKLAGKKKEELPSETNGIHWENLAVGVCHVQEIDLLVDTIMSTHKRAHTTVRIGKIEENNPSLLLLSSPRLNLSGGLDDHMDKETQIRFIEGMFYNLFDAVQKEGRQYIAMPAAGLGAHGGKPEMYFAALMKAAKAFPKLNIIYHPNDHEKSFDKALKKAKLENVVKITKNVIFIAERLNQRGNPCALHIPADSDVIYGLSDIGGPWKSPPSKRHLLFLNKKNETSQTYIGALSTAPLNSFGVNPQAYATIIERNLGNSLDTPLGKEIKDTISIHVTTQQTPSISEHGIDPTIQAEPGSQAKNNARITGEQLNKISIKPTEGSEVLKSPKSSVVPDHISEPPKSSQTKAIEEHPSSKPVVQEEFLQQASRLSTKNSSDPRRIISSPAQNGLFAPPKESVQAKTQSATSSLSEQQLQEINQTIDQLTLEIESCWPYPNKALKQIKIDALSALITHAETMSLSNAIAAIKEEFPRVAEGTFSTRTAALLVRLEHSTKNLEIH